jgi:hypothetical protein
MKPKCTFAVIRRDPDPAKSLDEGALQKIARPVANDQDCSLRNFCTYIPVFAVLSTYVQVNYFYPGMGRGS